MRALHSWTEPKTGLEFVQLPAGEFRMGAAGTAGESEEDARPAHPVRLDGFWMARTEVTRAHYRTFMEATGHPAPQFWASPLFSHSDLLPVVGVSWDDAAAFCAWIGARLPTEAEWEYAARGTDGRRYPWGDDAPRWTLATRYVLMQQDYPTTPETRAIFNLRLNDDKPNRVGSCPGGASPFGLLDMAGNVYEWCADWYAPDYYARRPRENPTGPPAGQKRVVRGGSWASHADQLTTTHRGSARPTARTSVTGIRCVRAAVEPGG